MWKILVVDDNASNRTLLTELLQNVPTELLDGTAHCDEAANGYDAFEEYKRAIEAAKPYDLLLLDIAMPDESGIEVLKKIREDESARGIESGRGVPIIMVTGYEDQFSAAVAHGCDDYILKPIDVGILVEKIAQKLKNSA